MRTQAEVELRAIIYDIRDREINPNSHTIDLSTGKIMPRRIFKWDDNCLNDEGLALADKILKWHEKHKDIK